MMSSVSTLSRQPLHQFSGQEHSEAKKEPPRQQAESKQVDSTPSLTDQQLRYLAFQKARAIHHGWDPNEPIGMNISRFVPIRGELNREMVKEFDKTRIPFYENKVAEYNKTISLELSRTDRENLISDFIDTLVESVDVNINRVFGSSEETEDTRLGVRVGVLSAIRETAGVQDYRHVLRKHPELTQLKSQ